MFCHKPLGRVEFRHSLLLQLWQVNVFLGRDAKFSVILRRSSQAVSLGIFLASYQQCPVTIRG